MLGIDVHDCAHARDEAYRQRHARSRATCLTLEPGLYFQPDDLTVPEDLRGIGVRIEDDVARHRRRLPQPVGGAAALLGRRRGLDGRAARQG